MTVLEHLKEAGYDPLLAAGRSGAGTAECDGIEMRTFACIPCSLCDGDWAVAVEAAGKVEWSDGSLRGYPEGWPRSSEYRVTLYIPWNDVPEALRPQKPTW